MNLDVWYRGRYTGQARHRHPDPALRRRRRGHAAGLGWTAGSWASTNWTAACRARSPWARRPSSCPKDLRGTGEHVISVMVRNNGQQLGPRRRRLPQGGPRPGLGLAVQPRPATASPCRSPGRSRAIWAARTSRTRCAATPTTAASTASGWAGTCPASPTPSGPRPTWPRRSLDRRHDLVPHELRPEPAQGPGHHPGPDDRRSEHAALAGRYRVLIFVNGWNMVASSSPMSARSGPSSCPPASSTCTARTPWPWR